MPCLHIVLITAWFFFLAFSPQAMAFEQTPQWFDATHALQQHRVKGEVPVESLPYDPFGARKVEKGVIAKTREVGESDYFWIVDFTNYVNTGVFTPNEEKYVTYADLKRVSDHAYLFVESGLSISSSLMDQMMDQFELDIYPKVGAIFGDLPDALDGDPHLTILIATFVGTSLIGGTAAGYFDDANQYTSTESYHAGLGYSNECEMIYINEYFVKENDYTGELDTTVLGLFAHEYQHMLHWGLDRNENVWFNEGCSEFAMYASDYDETADQHKEMFALGPTDSLTSWDNTLAQYGAVYYFNRFLGDHHGGNMVIENLAHSTLKGAEGIDYYLRENHGTDFQTEFHNWTMANLFDTASGIYSYSFSDSPPYWWGTYESLFGDYLWGTSEFPIFFTQRTRPITSAVLETSLEPWANDYHLFQRGEGETGAFHGYISVEDDWLARITYANIKRTSSLSEVSYDLLEEVPVQLDPSGYGEFEIPASNTTFTVIVSSLSYGHGSSISNTTMEYTIGILPGNASHIVSDTTGPDPVTDLTVTDVSDNRITLQWTAPGDDGVEGMAASYELRYATSPLTTINFTTGSLVGNLSFPLAPGTVETVTPPDLPESSTLHFLLRIMDDAGHVAWSNPVSATNGPADVIPPASTTNLRLVARTATTATFSWTAPGDDSLSGMASAYDLRWSVDPITDVLSFRHGEFADTTSPKSTGLQEEATVTGLPEDTEHIYFALRTSDESGNISDLSNVVDLADGVSGISEDSWQLYQ